MGIHASFGTRRNLSLHARAGSLAVVVTLALLGSTTSASMLRRVPQGLRGNWTFAEGSGATAADSSGSGVSGTLRNGVSWTSQGRIGTALAFGGVNGTVSLGSNLSILQNTPAATLSCFVKLNAAVPSGSFQDLISISVNASGPTDTSRAALSIQGNGSGGNVFLGGRATDTESQKILVDPTNLTPGTWYHLTGVIDFQNNSLKVYVNGALSSSSSVSFAQITTANTVSTDASLGSQDSGDGNFLNGSLDEVQVYNLALGASQIQALASGDALSAHWTFDEGTGTSAGDSTGNGYAGTLRNGAQWASGQLGNALQITSNSQYVDLGGNLSILRNVNGATVAAWVKPSSAVPSGSFRELVSISVNAANPTNTSRVALALQGDGTSGGDLFAGARSTDTEGQKNLTRDTNLPLGVWTHVAATFDFSGKAIALYVNGARVGTSTADFIQSHTPNTVSTTAALAAQDTGDSNTFLGQLDDVRVYGRSLSECDIETLALHDGLHARWAFDEAGGAVASDSSGHGLQGTLKNGANFVPGLFGNAVQLSGNAFVNLGTNLDILDGVQAATVATWVKLSSVPASGSFRELISISVNNGATATNTSRVALSVLGNGSTASIFAGGRSTDTESQKTLTADAGLGAGTWYHVAAVIDFSRNVIKIYRNGSIIAMDAVAFAQPFTASGNSTSAALGAQDTGDSNYFQGLMDDTRVYCRALSDTELQMLAIPQVPVSPTNLQHLDGDSNVKLTWTAALGATSYNIYRSVISGTFGTPIANVSATTYLDTSLTNGTHYFYRVTGLNAAGEGSPSTQVEAVPAPLGTAPHQPVIITPSQITTQVSPPVVGSSDPNVTIKVFFNGVQEAATTISDSQGNWALTPSAKSDAVYSVTARASNAFGDSAASAPVSLTIDTTSPSIFSPLPANGSTSTSTTPAISALWSDSVSGIKVASAVVKLDGGTVSAVTSATGFSFIPPALGIGTHAILAQVSDLAGNLASLTWTFSVVGGSTDSIPPTVSGLVPQNGGFVSSARPFLSAGLSDSGGSGINASSVTMTLNGILVPANVTLANSNSGTVSFTPTVNLAEGQNALAVTVRDNSGNAGSASAAFTVDITSPVVAIASPLTSPPYPTSNVALSATLSDSGSGLVTTSVIVLLNGSDVTSQVTIAPTSTNGQGNPSALLVSGLLTGLSGTNTVSVSGRDLAQNSAQLTVTFSTSSGPPPPPVGPSYNIAAVSGGGQSGTINRGLQNPLVVQVTDATTGAPAAGVSVIFDVTAGGALVVAPAALTDGSGSTQVQLRLGPVAGANTVSARITASPDGPTATFSVQAQQPTITAQLPTGGWIEYPASAMPGTMQVTVKDAQGNGMSGVEVVPELVPASSAYGDFHPFRGVTDSGGNIRFAFATLLNAPVGTFTFRMKLPDFLDSGGNPIVSSTLSGQIRNPSTRSFQIQAGQGQLVLPGHSTPSKLSVDLIFPPDVPPPGPTDQFTFLINILEGTGTLLQGGSPSDGTLTPFGSTQALAMTAPGSTRFKFRYLKGPENQPDLIRVQGTDIFVIGVPQSYVVDVLGNVVRDPHASSPSSFSSSDLYKVRVLSEVGAGVPSITLQSQDGLFNNRSDQTGVAPLTATLNATEVNSSSPDQYSTYESDAFQITSEIFQTATATSGTPGVHVFGGEVLSWTPVSGGFTIPVSSVTATGAYPSANYLALGDDTDNHVVLFGTARGFGTLSGRTLQFFLNGVPVGSSTTDSNGVGSLAVTLVDQYYRVQVVDNQSQAVSFTMPHLRGDRFPNLTEEVQDVTGVDTGTESLDVWKTLLQDSTTGRAALNALPSANVEPLTTDQFKAAIKADLIKGGSAAAAADTAAASMASIFNATTTLDPAVGKWTVRIKLKTKPVQTAVTLGHELKHVEDASTASKGLTLIAKAVAPIRGWGGDQIVLIAAGKVFNDDYGRRANANDEAAALEAFKVYYAQTVEGPAWLQGANIVKELKSSGKNTGTIYSDMFDNAGNVLTGAQFVTAVRAHTDPEAVETRSASLLDGAAASAKAYADDADLKTAVDNLIRVANAGQQGAPFRNTLLHLHRSPNLLPRNK